ncbi:MAG: zf-HC2 domain-containing protein [Lachnospiraceae bacterium]|nr:zf-HC2 domain-containing protein [Lachnospiraceae bacterium]
MDCKRAMELITLFINAQLNSEDTEAFLNHIEDCAECREELEVNYSLMTAMKQLDEGTDLSDNYIDELNHKIEKCYLDELKRKRSCSRRRALLAVVVVLLVFINGITAKEKREKEDIQFFRMITGTEIPENTEESMYSTDSIGDTEKQDVFVESQYKE